MLIGINDQYQIKKIRNITDPGLTVIELDETDEYYPFRGWSDIRILSYCYKKTGEAVAVYPYIDLKIIEKLEQQEIAQANYLLDLDFRLSLLELGV